MKTHKFTLKSAQAMILGEMYTFAWQVTSNTYDIPKGILMISSPGAEDCFQQLKHQNSHNFT